MSIQLDTGSFASIVCWSEFHTLPTLSTVQCGILHAFLGTEYLTTKKPNVVKPFSCTAADETCSTNNLDAQQTDVILWKDKNNQEKKLLVNKT